jgi:GAF domain-containing protein
VSDLAAGGDRWPMFVAAATDQPVFRAVHAVPLRLRGQAIGALNLFHHQPARMHAEDLALGQAMADVATIAILQERALRRGEILNEQLQAALDSRVIIEQAKGVLAPHFRVPTDQAFNLLRGYCRGHNKRLAEVARELTLDPNLLRPVS